MKKKAKKSKQTEFMIIHHFNVWRDDEIVEVLRRYRDSCWVQLKDGRTMSVPNECLRVANVWPEV